ncbi:outer membrane beta-barrel protein [Pleionea sp. CnH1-48]|uniref:outer membrane beta-barrel protein n=1 Tax=Pleionea sp. CnH1-48 TaxID=2954494 RepID=UPI002097A8B5|nr:outer membrane beta-barrel protein [Pleionea sp. CnH1-48]MCO7224442.1 porin family protein [Pleionea sp. CnH1-48]
MLKGKWLFSALIAASSLQVEAGDWYTQLDISSTNQKGSLITSTIDTSIIDDTNNSFSFSLGKEFSPYFHADISYGNVREMTLFVDTCPDGATCISEGFTTQWDSKTLSVSAKPRLPLTDEWALFARVGYQKQNFTRTNGTSNGVVYATQKFEDHAFTWGLGASWKMSKDWVWHLEYHTANADIDWTNYSIGIRSYF